MFRNDQVLSIDVSLFRKGSVAETVRVTSFTFLYFQSFVSKNPKFQQLSSRRLDRFTRDRKWPVPELLSSLSYILADVGREEAALGANAFDLALINNHCCRIAEWRAPYAVPGRLPASRGRENRIDNVVSIIAPDKGMSTRTRAPRQHTSYPYVWIGLIAPL